MPRTRAQIFDLRTAYNAATAFYGNAASFFSQVSQDMNTSHVFVAQRLGKLIAAVTNLALSIELFLKSLAIASKAKVLTTHDLKMLFDVLPAKLRHSIEASYAGKIKDLPRLPAALEVLTSTTPHPPTEDDWVRASSSRLDGRDLATLLSNERDAFRTWRYLHESEKRGAVRYYRVDYLFLNLFVKTLQEYIGPRRRTHENIPNPSPNNLPNR